MMDISKRFLTDCAQIVQEIETARRDVEQPP
jgi:hypothetical protein